MQQYLGGEALERYKVGESERCSLRFEIELEPGNGHVKGHHRNVKISDFHIIALDFSFHPTKLKK